MVKPRLMARICLLLCLPAAHMRAADKPEWTTPIAPFQIADNLYYVGSKDLASYLVYTKGRHPDQLESGELPPRSSRRALNNWGSAGATLRSC
jgi:hypothetical protein